MIAFTGAAARLPAHEQDTIIATAAKIGVQATFLAAIRLAENGRAGREFGVLSESAPTYEAQARVAARSIRNSLFRFVTAHGGAWPVVEDAYSPDFIRAMADRWAPIGAANDPHGLNANWLGNVSRYYAESDLTLT